jgi:UDP-GlcNAc:undecaprenyl-phosphate GlcNAc-1-phosphate transferase
MIYTPHKLPQASSWFVPIMVLGVPIFDTTLVVVSRLRRHKPVFHADLTHTYHRLAYLGLDPSRAVACLHVTTLMLCLLAFIALSRPPREASIIFGATVLAGLTVLIFLVTRKPKPEGNEMASIEEE